MKPKAFYQFAGPSLVVMGVLMVFPLVVAIWLGMNFITFRNINDPQFVGFANYLEVLADTRFWDSLNFTILYTAVTVPIRMVLGFTIALLLDQVFGRVRGIFL